jgi:hypothetical protein
MIDALLVFAVLCGCLGAHRGSRAAMALLASTALTSALLWQEVPFNPWLWLAIDAAVIVAAVWRPLTVAKVLIVVLFIPSWVFYVDRDNPAGPNVSTLAVSAQLLLTFPFREARQVIPRIIARWKRTFQHRDEWTNIDPREAHA